MSLTPRIALTKNRSRQSKLAKVHILVITASQEINTLLFDILSALGFKRIHCELDANNAINLMKKIRFHFVISDLDIEAKTMGSDGFPSVINGYGFVKHIRNLDSAHNPFVPIIMITHDMRRDDALKARDCGVNSIILKPFEAKQLCDAMREILEHPRIFITADTYKGPCRRIEKRGLPEGITEDRRVYEVCVVKFPGS
jgi:CheY-like chemotaxis protein